MNRGGVSGTRKVRKVRKVRQAAAHDGSPRPRDSDPTVRNPAWMLGFLTFLTFLSLLSLLTYRFPETPPRRCRGTPTAPTATTPPTRCSRAPARTREVTRRRILLQPRCITPESRDPVKAGHPTGLATSAPGMPSAPPCTRSVGGREIDSVESVRVAPGPRVARWPNPKGWGFGPLPENHGGPRWPTVPWASQEPVSMRVCGRFALGWPKVARAALGHLSARGWPTPVWATLRPVREPPRAIVSPVPSPRAR